MTPDLFDYAKRAKDEGMSRVEAHATAGWSELMFGLVVEVAKSKTQFTSDDVFDLAETRMPISTHDLRAFGPVMMKAARQKICRKANVAAVPSRRASLHASPRAVWESMIKGK